MLTLDAETLEALGAGDHWDQVTNQVWRSLVKHENRDQRAGFNDARATVSQSEATKAARATTRAVNKIRRRLIALLTEAKGVDAAGRRRAC